MKRILISFLHIVILIAPSCKPGQTDQKMIVDSTHNTHSDLGTTTTYKPYHFTAKEILNSQEADVDIFVWTKPADDITTNPNIADQQNPRW